MENQGIRLSSENSIMMEVCRFFTDEEQNVALAKRLLGNVGGQRFIDNRPLLHGLRMTFLILSEWMKRKPDEAYGKTLLSVLSTVNPEAAAELEERLLATGNQICL